MRFIKQNLLFGLMFRHQKIGINETDSKFKLETKFVVGQHFFEVFKGIDIRKKITVLASEQDGAAFSKEKTNNKL